MVVARGARCNISDPSGTQVYNPPNRGIPYWVTEPQYADPQDGTAAQFIAWGLKPGTAYHFRVRSYSGDVSQVFGAYSNTASATTADYAVRYVSPLGKDTNDGKGADSAHAWRTLAHGTGAIGCGQVLLVMGGNYATEEIRMAQRCSPAAKAVVLVNPGDTATIVSQPPSSGHALALAGDYLVIDGLGVASGGTPYGEYDAEISGSHNALLNVEVRPPVIPSFKFGVVVSGQHNLVYRSYLHDYGSPDAAQNPDGGGGFVLAVLGGAENTIWSNHLTRGGHDESLCKSGCRHNRWLNNVMDGGWGQGWISVGGSEHNLVEGNFIRGVGQLEPSYKPAIQVSGANNTVRRNVAINTKTWALEVSAFGGVTSYSQVYNNVFYDSGGCYFQSSAGGSRGYNHVVFANNICYKVRDVAFQIYLGNTTDRNTSNDILSVDRAGKPQPERAFVVWNQLGGGPYESAKSIATADRSYNPVFSRNQALSVVPRFVDEANLDFRLSAGSPLLDAGIAIADAEWGATVGPVDLGAFGIAVSSAAAMPADSAMDSARAGDYQAAVQAVRARPGMPNAQAVEAALLRAAFDDEGAARVLAGMGTPGAGDLMARYERVRQGIGDPALWDLLAANPERLLEMADLYIQWGLLRDAMLLVTHRYPQPVPALSGALMLYYRSYCRYLLDYTYYAGEDLRAAATLPVKGLSPRFPGELLVLQSTVQRNPTDVNAHFLLALLHHNAGRESAAREALQNVLKLRPGFPDAEALLAELGPGPAPARKIRPAGSGPAPDAPDPATIAAGTSPREIAAMALRIAASGDIGGAMSYFTPAKFPNEKQEDAVREAYIELRLRRLVALASARQCAAARLGLANLEGEDKSLPFTSQGFASFTKGVRFQYWLGVVESACVDQNAARRRWEALAKASPDLASIDHAYPYMALAKLDPAEAAIQARKALGFLQRQLGSALPEYQGRLLYSQGVLQLVAGRKDDAAASFRAGAVAGPAGMVEYLNLEAIRLLDAGQ
jgi:tetratricopeptide (TPR) repeat protein